MFVRRRAAGGLSVAFVNHADFRSNSGIHIFNLANNLVRLGVSCTVLVPHDAASVEWIGEPRFDVLEYRDVRRARPTLIHAWTPRPVVRDMTTELVRRRHIPYVVHLEDNEDVIAADRAGHNLDQILGLEARELAEIAEAGPGASTEIPPTVSRHNGRHPDTHGVQAGWSASPGCMACL